MGAQRVVAAKAKVMVGAGPVAQLPAARRSELWGETCALWDAGHIQAKLAISQPDDPSEREADRIAEQVMRMPAPVIQPTCAECSTTKCSGSQGCAACRDDTRLQRKTSGRASPLVDPPLHALGAGEPLSRATRTDFESRFAHDFGAVRIHADHTAGRAARAIDARAFTFGRHIVFGSGEFAPASDAGRRLLAHELTHVVQQGAAPASKVDTSDASWRATASPLALMPEPVPAMPPSSKPPAEAPLDPHQTFLRITLPSAIASIGAVPTPYSQALHSLYSRGLAQAQASTLVPTADRGLQYPGLEYPEVPVEITVGSMTKTVRFSLALLQDPTNPINGDALPLTNTKALVILNELSDSGFALFWRRRRLTTGASGVT